MAVTLTIPNEFWFELGKGGVDFSSDSFKIVVMGDGFVFDKDTDGTYADISADEITSAGGYTVGGESLAITTAWNQDNTDDEANLAFTDKVLTASGAAFDTFCGAAIIDDDHASDLIIGYIALGADIDVADGQSFTFQDMSFSLAQKAE